MAHVRTANRNGGANARVKLIEAITAPLGFFVLALLIVESFLASVLVGTQLPPENKVTLTYFGIGLFVFVVIIVSIFAWFKPNNLTFDKDAHLDDRAKTPYGSESKKIRPEELFSSPKKEETVV